MKRYKIFPLILLILFLGIGCASNAAKDSGDTTYENYTDIPDVTQEEIEAIEALKTRYGSFSVAMNPSTEAFYQNNGTIGGYSSLFCDWLSVLFDIPFTTEIVGWDALIEGLSTHQVDFTGELTATAERRHTYYMTDAIAERSIKSFRLRTAESLSELAAGRQLRYAFLAGGTTANHVRESSEYDFTATYVQDHKEAIALLEDGSIDAFFAENHAEAAFDEYDNIVAVDFFPLVYTPVSLSTANPALAPIISVVQKYLNHGALYHLTALYNEGEQQYRRHKLYTQLSQEEKSYLLSRTQAIPIAAEYDNYPASFYNETEGAWQGVANDVLAEISALTGLHFTIVNGAKETGREQVEKLEQGQVALITTLTFSEENKDKFLWPEEGYSTDHFALISLSGQENIKVNQIWHSSVAVAKGTAYEKKFDEWFPNHQRLLRLDNADDCYAALEDGRADFVMAGRNSMLRMTNYSEKSGFKVNILFGYTYRSSFGLNKKEKTLCAILSKAQKMVDTEGITDHWAHRVFDYRAKMARAQVPYLIGLAALLAVILTLLFILLLRHRKSGKRLEQLVRQRTAELVVQTEAAQKASRDKGAFLSHMSHEIRTPLNAIIGMAQVSGQVPDVPEKARSANHKIISASHHLLDILNDILDMAKIESGQFTLLNEPFSLLTALQEVAEIMMQRCHEKAIHFETGFNELERIHVVGDKLRLKQVLINLLGNAVKFTDSKGNVRFMVTVMSESSEAITLHFSVKDSGIGMSEEQVSRLFHAFMQASASVGVKYGGTGLGLAISQNMVMKMGGKIMVESQLGQGSNFWFVLTFKKSELPVEIPEEGKAPDLQGQRILVAEDIEINRLVLAELLDDTGVIIDEAENGRKALELFRASAEGYYDLIMMDIQMPEMDGYEATRAIRALPRGDAKTVPIIAMTANAFSEDVEKSLTNGLNGHITKPIDISVVRGLLTRFMGCTEKS